MPNHIKCSQRKRALWTLSQASYPTQPLNNPIPSCKKQRMPRESWHKRAMQ